MTTIYLIRHGENDFLNRRMAGWLPGVHLNEQGKAQAQALAEVLSHVRLEAVYSSPLERAMETAEPLARAQGLRVIPRPDLGETHMGTWEGQTLRALRRRKLWQLLKTTPSLVRFPQGEAVSEAQARVVREIEALRQTHKRARACIACVSHSDIIKLAISYYIGLPLDMYQRLSVSPASISVLRFAHDHPRLLRLNDTAARQRAAGE
jgi:probable phosphomutase (TIGR03848 family)